MQDRGGRNVLRRFGDEDIICRDAAGSNRCLRFGTAFEQAALDEQTIDTNRAGHGPAAGNTRHQSAGDGGVRAPEQVAPLCCYFQSAHFEPNRSGRRQGAHGSEKG
jgi:hypothetical protein